MTADSAGTLWAQSGTNRAGTGWYGPSPAETTQHSRSARRTPKPLALQRFRLLTRGFVWSTPNGIRTRAATLRGWCPRPLDDGGLMKLSGEPSRWLGGEDSNPQ